VTRAKNSVSEALRSAGRCVRRDQRDADAVLRVHGLQLLALAVLGLKQAARVVAAVGLALELRAEPRARDQSLEGPPGLADLKHAAGQGRGPRILRHQRVPAGHVIRRRLAAERERDEAARDEAADEAGAQPPHGSPMLRCRARVCQGNGARMFGGPEGDCAR
jgi:hypothetical protein